MKNYNYNYLSSLSLLVVIIGFYIYVVSNLSVANNIQIKDDIEQLPSKRPFIKRLHLILDLISLCDETQWNSYFVKLEGGEGVAPTSVDWNSMVKAPSVSSGL